jgi:hypothetical protein
MNVGETVTIPFAKTTKQGVVVRITEKNAWLKVDFPRHPGKLIRRKLTDLKASEKKAPKKAKTKTPKKKAPEATETTP